MLFFHVYQFEKDKECRFRFSYTKLGKTDISGSVYINLSMPGYNAKFDTESDKLLNENEKYEIVAEVKNNLNT